MLLVVVVFLHAASSLVSVALVFTSWALASINDPLFFLRMTMIYMFTAVEVARFAIASSPCALARESCGSSSVKLA